MLADVLQTIEDIRGDGLEKGKLGGIERDKAVREKERPSKESCEVAKWVHAARRLAVPLAGSS